MGRFEETQTQAQAAQPEVLQPIRAPTTHSDVAVPFQQAAIIGLLISAPLLVGAYGLGLRLALEQWLAAGCVLFCGVTLGGFFWRMGIVTEALHRVETFTGVDLEGDGSVGAHAAAVGRGPGERVDPVDRMRRLMPQFVRVCYETSRNGKAGTQPKLREAGFEDKDIDLLRDAMVRQGIAAWASSNHKAGLKLLVSHEEAQDLADKIIWLPNGKVWKD